MGRFLRSRAALAEAERLERVDADAALVILDALLVSAELDERGYAEAHLLRARALFFARRLRASADASCEAEARFASRAEPDGHARAKVVLGGVFSALGHEEAALEVLDDAIRIARSPEVPFATLANALGARASALRRAGRLEEAVSGFAEAIEVADRADVPRAQVTALVNQASTAWQVGRVEEARAALDRSRSLITEHGIEDLETWQAAIESWVAIAAHDFDRARACAEASLAGSGDSDARLSAMRALARSLALAPGADEAAIARATSILEDLAARTEREGWWADRVFVCDELAEVREVGGDLAGALRWTREAVRAGQSADRQRRAQRLEGERLRLELARVAVEAEQLRVRTDTLAKANRELAAMAEERAHLLATVAHDLRTPLTAIRCTLEYQRTRDTREDRPADLLYELIDEAAERMIVMVDDVLSTDAIRAGRTPIRRRPLDLASVVARGIEGLRPLARRKAIQLEVSGERALPIVSDEPATARVIDNVVSNALKFTGPEARVRIEIAREPRWAVVRVIDQGPGFAPAELEGTLLLGQPGRARPTAGEGSTGVGLSVVHELMRAVGGRVELANAGARGARVTLRWPLD